MTQSQKDKAKAENQVTILGKIPKEAKVVAKRATTVVNQVTSLENAPIHNNPCVLFSVLVNKTVNSTFKLPVAPPAGWLDYVGWTTGAWGRLFNIKYCH